MRSQINMNHQSETRDIPAASLEAIDRLNIDEIIRRAREIHKEHGGVFGYDFEDWLQAWEELPERDTRNAN